MKTEKEQIEKLKESLKMQVAFNDDLLLALKEQPDQVLMEVRRKLLNMRAMSSKTEVINRTERLVQHGYDKCIKELLMWLENIKENCDETYNNRKDS